MFVKVVIMLYDVTDIYVTLGWEVYEELPGHNTKIQYNECLFDYVKVDSYLAKDTGCPSI